MASKTTSTQESKPPAWAAPLFSQSASEASKLYNSGQGGNPYMGSTIADLSDTTMQGVNQLAQAGQAWDTSGTRSLFGQIGAGAVSNPFINKLSGVADQAGAPTSAATNLQGYASGANLSGEGNPFYRQRMEGELGDAAAQVRSAMSGMGRGGGGAETRALTDRLGQMRLEGLENDWNREQQNQFNAVGMIDAANQNALGLQGNLLSNAGGMYSTGIGQAQNAASSMAGLDQQNFQNRLTGAGATLQAGGLLDDQANRMAMEEANRFYETDNAGWNRLGLLQSAAAGAAGPYGSQSGTSRTSNPGAILGGIGSMMGGK